MGYTLAGGGSRTGGSRAVAERANESIVGQLQALTKASSSHRTVAGRETRGPGAGRLMNTDSTNAVVGCH